MILGLGVPELIVILIVCLVVFGPKNLPKLGSAMGKTVKNFRDGMEADDAPKTAVAEARSMADEACEVVADSDDADV